MVSTVVVAVVAVAACLESDGARSLPHLPRLRLRLHPRPLRVAPPLDAQEAQVRRDPPRCGEDQAERTLLSEGLHRGLVHAGQDHPCQAKAAGCGGVGRLRRRLQPRACVEGPTHVMCTCMCMLLVHVHVQYGRLQPYASGSRLQPYVCAVHCATAL